MGAKRKKSETDRPTLPYYPLGCLEKIIIQSFNLKGYYVLDILFSFFMGVRRPTKIFRVNHLPNKTLFLTV